ncbi:OmpA family protein [Vibrio xiamenensis]|nr:OmpA family protein [Vibrio xiamenensis]
MRRNRLLSVALMCAACSSLAADYVVPFDEVKWHAEKADGGCRLYSSDDHSGIKVTFSTASAKPVALTITGRSIHSFGEDLLVETEPPIWGANHYETTTVSQVTRNKKSLTLDQGDDLIYRDIKSGAWLTVRDLFHSVTFPTANIREALNVFQSCTTHLPPVSFNQAQKTVFNFKSGALALTPAQREEIEAIAQLIHFDKRIVKVLLTGHSDNQGDTVVNLSVSKRRAQDVAYWLMLAGIPEEMMETRGQGDRYPVASNMDEKGRYQNRRVEVELVRQ